MSKSEELSIAFYGRLGAEGLAARTTPAWDEQILSRLREMLAPGLRVLDAGCGYGRIAIPLALFGCEVTGLDISPALLRAGGESASQKRVSLRWVQASLCRMPLPDGYFDAVLCLWSVFHELLEEDEQIQAVGEMHRVLRPNGWALIEGPVFQPPSCEQIASGQRYGPECRLSADIVAGLPNPHYCHDAASYGRLMGRAGISRFAVYVAEWAGRPRQFLRFERPAAGD